MPKVYVLVGVPGSGKSTWAKSQDWLQDCVYISTDELVEEHARQVGKTYTEVFNDYMPEAVELMTKQVIEAREQGRDIIWDQTSTSVASRKKKFRLLPNYEHIAVVFHEPPINELKERLANRPGKIIPWEVVSNMINNFEMPSTNEGYKEIWYVT